MKNIETLIENNKISKIRSEKIAESQFDLGGVYKTDMVTALSDINNEKRLIAFNRLDVISQFIVFSVLDSEFSTPDGLKDHFTYISKCINAVKDK